MRLLEKDLLYVGNRSVALPGSDPIGLSCTDLSARCLQHDTNTGIQKQREMKRMLEGLESDDCGVRTLLDKLQRRVLSSVGRPQAKRHPRVQDTLSCTPRCNQ